MNDSAQGSTDTGLISAQQKQQTLQERLKQLLPRPSDEEIVKLKEKARAANSLAEPTIITTESGLCVVVTVPVPAEAYRTFRRRISTASMKDQALENLFRDVVLYPDANSLETALTLKPGLSETFGGEVAKLAGLEDHVEGKPL